MNVSDWCHFFRFNTLLVFALIGISSCDYDCETVTRTIYSRQVFDVQSLQSEIGIVPSEEIETPGGLFYKDGYVFINERGKGIHILDNSTPSAPAPVAFLKIPGNYAMSARLNYLYVDSYLDLFVFDISDPKDIKQLGKQEGVFESTLDPHVVVDQSDQVIYRYVGEEVTATECEFEEIFAGEDDYDSQPVSSETGSSGSMARFVVTDKVLYTVDPIALTVFDVSDPAIPSKKKRVELGFGIETIFPHEGNLFIGSQTGMHIYGLADPNSPEHISTYSHVTACDPVVVQGDYAYVTLRSGAGCNTFSNQLDIVDISNLAEPKLAKTYDMLNPYGLGISGACLFICEGSHGLKAFDVNTEDATEITLTEWFKDVDAFDVITLPNTLMMVGKDGFYQYSYECGENLEYLSKIGFQGYF